MTASLASLLDLATSMTVIEVEEGARHAKRLMSPELYKMDAMNDERTLKDFECYEQYQKKMQAKVDGGLLNCTRLMEEKGLDLQSLADKIVTGSAFPSGLPLELEDWVASCVAADVLGARLERMRALRQSREHTSGKLQASVLRQLASNCEAEAPVIMMRAKSGASQSASRPAGRAPARPFAADHDVEEDVTAPLLAKPTRTKVSEEEETEATPLLQRQSSYICRSGCHSEVGRHSIGAGAGDYRWGARLVW